MKVISFHDIIECNQLLKEKDLRFKIHLRDACGKQSCWIEPLEENKSEEQYEELHRKLEEFFVMRGFTLEYSEDQLNFWILQ